MINGNNARIIVIGLIIAVVMLIASITALSFVNKAVPDVLTITLSSCIGAIVGAIGLNFQLGEKTKP